VSDACRSLGARAIGGHTRAESDRDPRIIEDTSHYMLRR
jgi:hypothetical protein